MMKGGEGDGEEPEEIQQTPAVWFEKIRGKSGSPVGNTSLCHSPGVYGSAGIIPGHKLDYTDNLF